MSFYSFYILSGVLALCSVNAKEKKLFELAGAKTVKAGEKLFVHEK